MIKSTKSLKFILLFFLLLGSVCYGSAVDNDFCVRINQFYMQVGWGIDCPIQKADKVSFYYQLLQLLSENYLSVKQQKCNIFIYMYFEKDTYYLDYYYNDELKKTYSVKDENGCKPVLLGVIKDVLPFAISTFPQNLVLYMVSESSDKESSISSEIIMNSFVDSVNSQGYLFSYFFRLEDAILSISDLKDSTVVIINRKELKMNEIDNRFYVTDLR